MSKKSKDWEYFEKLIERINWAIDKTDAYIVRDHKVPDIHTGQNRQVDVAVFSTINGTQHFVAFECRRRKKTEDVTWIEQLATKRYSIDAKQIIAVSASKFSRPAIKKAKALGVTLWSHSSLNDEVILSMLQSTELPRKISHLILSVKVHLGDGTSISMPLEKGKASREELESPFLFDRENNSSVSLQDFFGWVLIDKKDQISPAISEDSKVRLGIRFSEWKYSILDRFPATPVIEIVFESFAKVQYFRMYEPESFSLEQDERLAYFGSNTRYELDCETVDRLILFDVDTNLIQDLIDHIRPTAEQPSNHPAEKVARAGKRKAKSPQLKPRSRSNRPQKKRAES